MSQNDIENHRKKILILSDYYLPGYKSGGGMRTIVNIVDHFGDKYDFFILTRDHDGKLDREQYKTVKIDEWNSIKSAKVYYLSKDKIKISKLRELILKVQPDVIYSNSYFATLSFYLLILKKLRQIPPIGIIIAPCGELSDGALLLNPEKKKLFIKFSQIFGLNKNVIWKASSELERAEIEAVGIRGDEIIIAPDMLPKTIFANFDLKMKPLKKCGEVKMIFLSRFMKKKNFKWLLENLTEIAGKLEIDIYGPIEDQNYWNECQKIIEQLPENIKIEAKNSVPHEEVLQTLAKYHFFVMPTLGENFGHVFLEALAAGCPLLISDRTPWVNLEDKEIGWDISLDKPQDWVHKINLCIGLSQAAYSQMSSNAREFALKVLADAEFENATLKVFEKGLQMT